MKVVLRIALICTSLTISRMCDGSELKPVSREWDFGKVQQGSSKQMVFFVRNTGLDELVINNVHSCCGYSVDNVSKWTLAPGEKAEIALTCDASKKTLGRDKRYITLLSNSKVNPHELIPIKADISAAPEGFLPKKRPAARDKPSVQNEESTSSISAHDLYARISAGRDIMILDIRQSEECSEKYISNSIRLPAASILNDEAYLRDMLRNIEKTTLIAVLDWDGSGSTPITSKLKGLGYNALNVEGGISSWERNGYPITYNN